MERRVRETSRQADMLETAGDTEGAKSARCKLREQRKAYRDYSKEHGLAVHNDRLTVVKVRNGDTSYRNIYTSALDKSGESGIIRITNEKGIENNMKFFSETHTAAGNRRSPLYKLSEADVKLVQEEITAINANINDFVFNSDYTRGTCFLASDGKVHIKGNIFPDEYSEHPRDKMSVRAVLAHEYYGHIPYREQYIREDNDTSDESINKIMAQAWADEFRASYMAAKNAPNLSDDDRRLLILDSLSRAEEAGISIKYNDFIRRVLYG